ncbi:anaerobic ribonucleoside-triphosphate reductase [Allopusillimonas ginsengisoli]|uniref:anaerobic ribonucleoside-triphosphate reductase n=1 Tax=Allopusillimonas ginsengisoli TaxID=453575 RepID=UPI00197D52C6
MNTTHKHQLTTITLSDEERQPCEIWTRVMGYHRPMSSFNIGKKGEFHERKYFRESVANGAAQPITTQTGGQNRGARIAA